MFCMQAQFVLMIRFCEQMFQGTTLHDGPMFWSLFYNGDNCQSLPRQFGCIKILIVHLITGTGLVLICLQDVCPSRKKQEASSSATDQPLFYDFFWEDRCDQESELKALNEGPGTCALSIDRCIQWGCYQLYSRKSQMPIFLSEEYIVNSCHW